MLEPDVLRTHIGDYLKEPQQDTIRLTSEHLCYSFVCVCVGVFEGMEGVVRNQKATRYRDENEDKMIKHFDVKTSH